MIQVVNSTARLFGFNEIDNTTYGKGYHNLLTLWYTTDSHDHVNAIELYLEGSPKSTEFKKVESRLTLDLLHIDSHITVDTGHDPNPMM